MMPFQTRNTSHTTRCLLVLVALCSAISSLEAFRSMESCPCLTLEELEANEQSLEEDIIINGTQFFEDEDIDSRAYGIGCASHDSNTSICNGRNAGDWCNTPWCYIDPRNCDLRNHPSELFVARHYSTAACGFIDVYERAPSRLNRTTLQGVLHQNYRGYQGTICGKDSNNNKECVGTIVRLAKYLEEEPGYNISINYTEVPNWIADRANSYADFRENNENKDHAPCVYAVGMGIVDVCFGAFTKNIQRAKIADYVEMGVTAEYLIVPQVVSKKTPREMIGAIFLPFSINLWMVTFGVLAILSLILTLQEMPWNEIRVKPISIIWKALYHSFLEFFAQETFVAQDDARTWGGRLTLLAIAVQILLSGAAYTANLTNFLVRGSYSSSISSLDEAIQKQKSICVLRNKISILKKSYGASIKFATSPDDNKEGFRDRSDLFPAMDKGLCFGTVTDLETLEIEYSEGQHCNKIVVGQPVIQLPWGIPVSSEFSGPLNTIITDMMAKGIWQELVEEARPASQCMEEIMDNETTALTPEQLLGSYVVSGCLAVIGILLTTGVRWTRKTKETRRKKSKASDDSFSPATSSAPCKPNDDEIGQNGEDIQLDEDPSQLYQSCDIGVEEIGENSHISKADHYSLHAAMKNLQADIASLKATMEGEGKTRDCRRK